MIIKEQKSRTGNMYQFVDDTWNPIVGKCLHECAYCYVSKRCKNQKEIHLVSKTLYRDLGSGNTIFPVSGSDMFAENVPELWILQVLNRCYATNHNLPDHKNSFMFQTKNPKRVLGFINHPIFNDEKTKVCTTIETNRWYEEMGKAPKPEYRADAMAEIASKGITTIVTAEPLMKFDHTEMLEIIKRCKPEQVNIGKNSNFKIKLPEPTADEVKRLIDELENFSTIVIKSNALDWVE